MKIKVNPWLKKTTDFDIVIYQWQVYTPNVIFRNLQIQHYILSKKKQVVLTAITTSPAALER